MTGSFPKQEKKFLMKTRSTNKKDDILLKLYGVVQKRRQCPRPDSYTSSLLQKGRTKINSKIEEEAGELCEASQKASRSEIIHEMGDLWFHCIVLLGYWDIPPEEVFRELTRRWGQSGLEEKAQRKKT
jgi:phosphoribosyl-ATP pyrophosphohydrolase